MMSQLSYSWSLNDVPVELQLKLIDLQANNLFKEEAQTRKTSCILQLLA